MKFRAVLLILILATIFSFSVAASVSAHQGQGLKPITKAFAPHHHK